MLVWIIKEGEYLPIQPGARKMRCWLMADALRERGHEVVWWHSTFSHQGKTLLAESDQDIQIEPRFTLKLTHAGTYVRNFSFRRYYHGKRLARRFPRRIETEPRPDLIICAFPPIDIAAEVVKYARCHGIPVVIDVQDIWPDAIVKKMPPLLRPIAQMMLQRDFRRTKEFLAGASSIVAVSDGFLRRSLDYAGRARSDSDLVVHLGYKTPSGEVGELGARIRELREVATGKVIFSYIGSFGRSYELKLVCEAAARLGSDENQGIHFAIAGSGEQYESIQRTATNLSNVTLLGWLNDSELQQLLSVSDVGLVPCISDIDTMPNKPFEYFSHGLPILSSLEGDMEKLITESQVGFSYRHGDVDTFLALAVRLAEDEALRLELGENAKRIFMQRFRAEVLYCRFAARVELLARREATC